MSKFTKALKVEITRLSRKESRAAVRSVRQPSNAAKKSVVALKKRLSALEKSFAELHKKLSRCEAVTPVLAEVDTKARITGKGMKSLRRKLRLTGAEFAKLLGVSLQIVYLWERKSGALNVREATRAAILGIRGFGAREAKARLDGMAVVKVVKKGKK